MTKRPNIEPSASVSPTPAPFPLDDKAIERIKTAWGRVVTERRQNQFRSAVGHYVNGGKFGSPTAPNVTTERAIDAAASEMAECADKLLTLIKSPAGNAIFAMTGLNARPECLSSGNPTAIWSKPRYIQAALLTGQKISLKNVSILKRSNKPIFHLQTFSYRSALIDHLRVLVKLPEVLSDLRNDLSDAGLGPISPFRDPLETFLFALTSIHLNETGAIPIIFPKNPGDVKSNTLAGLVCGLAGEMSIEQRKYTMNTFVAYCHKRYPAIFDNFKRQALIDDKGRRIERSYQPVNGDECMFSVSRRSITMLAFVGACSTSTLANDEQFSMCRINFVSHWVAKNCPGQISPSDLAQVDQMLDFVGRTAPDCYREGDAKNDVERMLAAGGKSNSCKFYASFLRQMLH